MCGLLLSRGAQVDARTAAGSTALHLAAHGHEKVVELLLGHDALVDAKNDKRQTPLMFATVKGAHEVAKRLLESGADLLQQDPKGRTAADLARMLGDVALLELLEARGEELEKEEL